MDERTRLPFPGPGIEAVIFDLDGVVTDTARIHEDAWQSVFDQFLEEHAITDGHDFIPFTSEEYARYVDGKPRYEGAESFLRSRGIDLPLGDPSDPPGDTSVAALSNLKNERFLFTLNEVGVDPYPESVRVIRELRQAGIQTGLITSSRNGRAVLKAAGVTSLFNAIIDGVDAAAAGLPGKPAPDVFLAAAVLLGSLPDRTAIVEDAQSGVSAGREAGFGFVLGVDRLGQAEELLTAGAHAVVSDLGELEVTTLAAPEAVVRAVAASTGHPAGQRTPELPLADGTLLSELPSALNSRAELSDRLRAGHPVVFLDYDGTLSPIVDDPADATMPDDVRQSVERLAAMVPVAIVSGRDLRDVRARADVAGTWVAGSHGFEIDNPEGHTVSTGRDEAFSAYLPALDSAESVLRQQLTLIDGVIVERKRFAIAVHFRMADESAVEPIEQAVERLRQRSDALRVTGGKKIFELRPNVDWDKGAALEVLLGIEGLAGTDAVPLYLGDDLTDEDGFRAVHAHGGIAVAVRGEEDRPTIADYALGDVGEVAQFLAFIASALEGAGRP